MDSFSTLRVLGPALIVACVLAAGDAAWAQTDGSAAAARLFREGKAAYDDGDFRHAAERFEEAYRTAPHPFALWNAARSWDRAGEYLRAAALYDEYLEKFADGPDIEAARAARVALDAKVARLDLPTEAWPDGITVDGKAATGARLVVLVGTHTIEGRRGSRVARAEVTVRGGETVRVVLATEDAPPARPPAEEPRPSQPPPPTPAPGRPRPWSPLVVYVAGGVAVVGGALTVLSGLDTQSWKSDHFDKDPSKANLDAGKDREHRTNALLVGSLAVATFTAVAAIFFVDWRPRAAVGAARPLRIGVGPAGVTGELP